MFKCVHGFALKLLCDMIVMASDVYETNTRNTNSHNLMLNAVENLNYADAKVWTGVPKNIHAECTISQWRHLNIPLRNLILST